MINNVLKNPFTKKSYQFYGRDFDISLGGGEPFLVTNLQDIINTIEKYLPGSFKSITTNGLLTDRILEFVAENKLLRYKINVSVDGIGRIHDRIRGGKGFFKKTIDTVLKIRKLYPAQKIELKLTLLPQNHDQIHKVYKLSKRMGCDFSFKPAENIKSYTNQKKPIQLKFNRKQLCLIRNQALEISDDYYKIKNHKKAKFFKDIVFYLYERLGRDKCSVLENDITILPSGEIFTCLLMHPIGHVQENSLGATWRKQTNNEKSCPSCMLMCGAYKDYSDTDNKLKVANIETTLRCNLKCDMCTQRELRFKNIKDMSLPIFKNLINRHKDIGHVSFLGGEPFLNKNLFEMLNFLDSKGITSEITTNGTIAKARELSYLENIAGLKAMNFSLEGLKEENDKIRGKGTFIKCLRMLLMAKDKFNVSVNTVIRGNNFTEIKKLSRLLKSKGIKHHKLIAAMNLDQNSRKQSKKLLKGLNIQGPSFKENTIDHKKLSFFSMDLKNSLEDSRFKITIEPECFGTRKTYSIIGDNPLACKQLKQYRFTTTGQRIVCEFIRNSYDLKKEFIKRGTLLPICNNCCKLT